jgi:hypothetical protein
MFVAYKHISLGYIHIGEQCMFSYTDVAKQFSEVIAPFYTPASNV